MYITLFIYLHKYIFYKVLSLINDKNINNQYFILMVISTPLLRKRIVKKRTLKFTRFQSDLYGGRLAESWRRPRGKIVI